MKKILLFISCVVLVCSCDRAFITDKNYLSVVEVDFNQRKNKLNNTPYFDIFDTDMSQEQREAMQFLYAYMPLGDIYDYNADLFLKSVNATLSLKDSLSWVGGIPEEVFRHFVMPIRVNNEYLDSARYTLFSELYPRVKELNMYDAALEVNHWCHENVVYKPSDSRTSSPLATMKTAHGRCGEESVFTTAALRAVGIPARQVYTPRWAHTDDNHAWVEVWVDGQWYYMGACEPEPKLNIAWFSKTVQRGLLMHTKVFGKYNGPEQKMLHTPNFTEINVTENYAPTVKSVVTVKSIEGKIIEGAEVSFRIYNYATFFPVLTQITSKEGTAEIISGMGDMFVWASKGNNFGFKILSADKINNIDIVLDRKVGDIISENFDVAPPKEGLDEVLVTSEQRDANSERLIEEDTIRNGYISTFMTGAQAEEMAEELGFNKEKVKKFILQSRGNWSEIADFLRSSKDSKEKAISLLETLLEKDFRDVKSIELLDHLNHSPSTEYSQYYNEYVLSPRVSNELISIYKKPLQGMFGKKYIAQFQNNPIEFVEWVNKNIRVESAENSIGVPIFPVGVHNSKLTDSHSRDIFFVAACRSFGIPARLERVTGKVQFYNNNVWNDVEFGDKNQKTTPKGYLKLKYTADKVIDNPLYDMHFTISKYEGGEFKLMNFRNSGGFEGSASYRTTFKEPVALDKGYYMLVTGRRMASGKVLTSVVMFNISEDKTTKMDLVIREDKNDISVIGNLNPEELFLLEGDSTQKSILAESGRGYFVIAILGAKQEPTSHLLRDIVPFNKQFENWDRKMIMLFKNSTDLNRFDKGEFPPLPKNMVYGVDVNEKITNMLVKNLKIHNSHNLPIVVIADTFGRVVYFSQGYSTGQGEQLINVIKKL